MCWVVPGYGATPYTTLCLAAEEAVDAEQSRMLLFPMALEMKVKGYEHYQIADFGMTSKQLLSKYFLSEWI